MDKNQPKIGYTVKEVDARIEKYIQKSAGRLIRNLRIAWKGNNISSKKI